MAQVRVPVKNNPGLYKRGESFQFRVSIGNGKRRWQTIPGGDIGPRAAVSWMNTYLGKDHVGEPSTKTVIEYFNEWFPLQRLKAGSRRNYLNHMENLERLHHRKVNDLKPADIRATIRELEAKPLAPATIAATFTPLRSMYATLLADGGVDASPFQRLERKALPPVEDRDYPILSSEQALALVSAAENMTLKVHVALGLLAGLRLSESLGLQWEDVKWEGTTKKRKPHLHVWRQLEPSYTKGDTAKLVVGLKGEKGLAKEKRVEIPPALLQLLAQHSLATGGEGFVICTEREPRREIHKPAGSPQSHTNMRLRFKKLRLQVEPHIELVDGVEVIRGPLEDLRYHDLRHNFASALISQGEDVSFVQHQMGHANAMTTLNTYVHPFTDRDSEGESGASIEKAFGAAFVAPVENRKTAS